MDSNFQRVMFANSGRKQTDQTNVCKQGVFTNRTPTPPRTQTNSQTNKRKRTQTPTCLRPDRVIGLCMRAAARRSSAPRPPHTSTGAAGKAAAEEPAAEEPAAEEPAAAAEPPAVEAAAAELEATTVRLKGCLATPRAMSGKLARMYSMLRSTTRMKSS